MDTDEDASGSGGVAQQRRLDQDLHDVLQLSVFAVDGSDSELKG